jgi:hypothetical protein
MLEKSRTTSENMSSPETKRVKLTFKSLPTIHCNRSGEWHNACLQTTAITVLIFRFFCWSMTLSFLRKQGYWLSMSASKQSQLIATFSLHFIITATQPLFCIDWFCLRYCQTTWQRTMNLQGFTKIHGKIDVYLPGFTNSSSFFMSSLSLLSRNLKKTANARNET